ncbi:TetR/AcrR family transcriptional regulator [Streptomyces fuscigenes]|uniref:TetR/AcrR family transcriptional regulator n=1 Tax=Streptomyces fuscigenes TaxID=1528880 RepID=UPI001F384179|nr:TetR/AcrR family transcriptional regulator [Streptomyces fuscigenes]MCF3963530.1 TetR/AcrR family transcriptional regulator [Streptomyces fuscigenes]
MAGREDLEDGRGTARREERARIVDAASRCLAANAGATVSVGRILDEAGLSTRAFYRHFGSKDDLLGALFRKDADIFTAEMRAAAAVAAAPADALRLLVRGTLRLTWDPRRRGRVLLMVSEEAVRARGYAAERARIDAAARTLIAGIIERGRAAGDFPAVRDVAADAGSIGALLRHAVDEQLARPSPDAARAAADRVVGFALRALGGAGARP